MTAQREKGYEISKDTNAIIRSRPDGYPIGFALRQLARESCRGGASTTRHSRSPDGNAQTAASRFAISAARSVQEWLSALTDCEHPHGGQRRRRTSQLFPETVSGSVRAE